MHPFPPESRALLAKSVGAGLAALFVGFMILGLVATYEFQVCIGSSQTPIQRVASCSRAILLRAPFHNKADNPDWALANFQRAIAYADLDQPSNARADFQATLTMLGVERGFDQNNDLVNSSERVQSIFAQAAVLDPAGKAYPIWTDVMIKNE